MAGNNSHKGSVIQPSSDLEVLKLQYEHEEKTIWPERMLFAKAAVCVLRVAAVGSMLLLVLAIFKTDHIDKVIQVSGNIIVGVLSFLVVVVLAARCPYLQAEFPQHKTNYCHD